MNRYNGNFIADELLEKGELMFFEDFGNKYGIDIEVNDDRVYISVITDDGLEYKRNFKKELKELKKGKKNE